MVGETTQVTGDSMVRSSNSRNVRAAATGIQREAMAALMMVMAVGGLAMSAGRAEAQSKLPPCPSDESVRWNNCFGTVTWAGESNKFGYIDWKHNLFADGDKYVGEFKDGKYNGQGAYTFASGSKYVGEFKDDKQNGQGAYTFASGSKYVGEWKDDKRNGQGTSTWASGSKYVGEFKDGKRNGQGAFTFASGSKYVGEFKDGVANGAGKELDAKGNVIRQGYWVADHYFGPTAPR